MTFVYVTHDQEEALTMSDRIAVFNEGKIEQIGTPGGDVRAPAHGVRRGLHRHLERARAGRIADSPFDQRRSACSRPRRPEGEPGVVQTAVYLGAATRFVVELDEGWRAGRPAAEPRGVVVGCPCHGGQARPPRVAAGRGVHDQGGEVRKRIRLWHLALGGLVVALAVPAGGVSKTRRALPTKIGTGEGALSVVEWARVHRPELREEVRAADRLQDQAQGRRLVERDVQPHPRRRRRRRRSVRPRVGVRRREPASHLRGRRRAREREADPVLEELPAGVQVASAQHGQGRALRRLAAVGPEHAHLQHEEGQARSGELVGDLQPEVQGQDHRPEQPDPDRGRGAVPA